jgi:hypothetical protein
MTAAMANAMLEDDFRRIDHDKSAASRITRPSQNSQNEEEPQRRRKKSVDFSLLHEEHHDDREGNSSGPSHLQKKTRTAAAIRWTPKQVVDGTFHFASMCTETKHEILLAYLLLFFAHRNISTCNQCCTNGTYGSYTKGSRSI